MIHYGHDANKIGDYTFAQVFMWLDEHIAIEKEQRRNYMMETFIAAQCNKESLDKAIASLGG